MTAAGDMAADAIRESVGTIDMREDREVSGVYGHSHVVLDPSVEMLGVEIDGYRLLMHGAFETALAMPPGEGLVDLLNDLFDGPVAIAALYRAYAERDIVDAILAALFEAGFAHATSEALLPESELAPRRDAIAARRAGAQRRSITIDLDTPDAPAQLDALGDQWPAPELILRCARMAAHRETLSWLAGYRRSGAIRLLDVTVRTADPACDDALCRSLGDLGAAVIVDAVGWPVPATPIDGIAALTRHGIAVHLVLTPGGGILDPALRRDMLDRAEAQHISGLRLRIIPETLWPAGADAATHATLFAILDALEAEFGDVLVETLPNDETILGMAPPDPEVDRLSAPARALRRAWLRHRIPRLKASEGDNLWSQVPEVEDKLVRVEDDLLPTHPELLGLVPGSRVVDVCGGLGRVARRLSPLVGADGLVVSIEMLRLLSARARGFACERGFTNLSFRPGLAQRLPLADASMDAAVNEWTGGIWELGMGPAMLREMARVVRPGGRIAITHRLVRLPLERLAEPWVQYDDIYRWIRDAFAQSDLTIVTERIWGQIAPTLVGESATLWRKQYVPSIIDPFAFTYQSEVNPGCNADIFVTFIAENRPGAP